MTKEMKQNLGIVAVILGWTALFTWFGYSMGRINGYSQAFEDRKRIDCEIEFDNKPFAEIDGKCIKYFKEAK